MANARKIKAVGVILVNPRGQILLQQRDDKPGLLYAGHWTTFGGAVEEGESPDEAMRRELLEEIELEPPVRLWKVFEHSHQVNGAVMTVEQYIYVGRIEKEASEITLNEGQALGFFDADDLDHLPVAFGFETLFREFFMIEPTKIYTGLEHLAAIFANAKAHHRAAFLPYFPIGYPTYEASLDAIEAMAEAGVDGFEIGVPFSDPLADGPVIQAATQIALENGMTVRKCLEAVRELRARGVHQPMLMMSYLNPLLAYGVDAFVRDARAAGADGVIVPDLPPEEAATFAEACKREGLAMVFFLAPTSNPARIAIVARQATGFIYVLSLTGVTGARDRLPPELADLIARVRAQAGDTRLVLGFGISKPEQARTMNGLVDGFIVGSALVRAGKEGPEAVRRLATSLREALD